MNGHLQLSISLKNYNEMQAAIDLLQSLLPQAQLKPFPKETGFYAVATKGDLVKLSTTKPTAPKHDRAYRDVEGKVHVHPAPKPKRNKKGQFVKQKK